MVKTDKGILSRDDAFSVIRNYKPEYQKAYIKEMKKLYSE